MDGLTGGEVTRLGVALAFGLVVMTMTHAIGDVYFRHLRIHPTATATATFRGAVLAVGASRGLRGCPPPLDAPVWSGG